MNITTVGVDPVSYTHLDVYKRQELTQHGIEVAFDGMDIVL